MPVKINGSSSGSVTLQAPASGSDVTVTLPAAAGTVAVVDGPTFTGNVALPATTTLGGSTLNLPGLVLVTPSSIANSGGSASASGGQVTFSGVTTVSLNGVFSASADFYRIVVSCTHSTEAQLQLRFRLSGTDSTSTYSSKLMYSRYDGTTVFGDAVRNNSDNWWIGTGGTRRGTVVDVTFPASAVPTMGAIVNGDNNAGSSGGAFHNTSTAYDGFTLLSNTGTLSGTVRVYSYRQA